MIPRSQYEAIEPHLAGIVDHAHGKAFEAFAAIWLAQGPARRRRLEQVLREGLPPLFLEMFADRLLRHRIR